MIIYYHLREEELRLVTLEIYLKCPGQAME
jgi:hypothetical protein